MSAKHSRKNVRVDACCFQYSVLHGEKVLREEIANLKLAISDQNLELIPDYESRIKVLQELKFIDENSTVLLKGRVACEVMIANSFRCSV
jgi:antiviral helicase SKI2